MCLLAKPPEVICIESEDEYHLRSEVYFILYIQLRKALHEFRKAAYLGLFGVSQ